MLRHFVRRQGCRLYSLAANRSRPDHKSQFFSDLRHRKRCCGRCSCRVQSLPLMRRIRNRRLRSQHPQGCISRPGPDGPRARQDWVHEHAETGKPFTADQQHGARGDDEPDRLFFQIALWTCNRQRRNGPAHVDHLVGVGLAPSERRKGVAGSAGQGGHKLSAIGSPFQNARSARQPLRFSALECGGPRQCSSRASDTLVIHAAHSQPPRLARVSIRPCRMPQLAKAAGRKGTMAKEICISSTPHETRLGNS